MLAYMPDTVQQAWGDVAVRDFTVWLETVMSEHTIGHDSWGQAQDRFDGLEAGQAKLEAGQVRLEAGQAEMAAKFDTRVTILEHDVADLKIEVRDLRREMHERFDRQAAEVNARLAEINARFAQVDARFAEMNARFDRVHQQILSQTRWTVGTLALFGTLIAILVGIGQLGRYMP